MLRNQQSLDGSDWYLVFTAGGKELKRNLGRAANECTKSMVVVVTML